jgi:hypothetical protein
MKCDLAGKPARLLQTMILKPLNSLPRYRHDLSSDTPREGFRIAVSQAIESHRHKGRFPSKGLTCHNGARTTSPIPIFRSAAVNRFVIILLPIVFATGTVLGTSSSAKAIVKSRPQEKSTTTLDGKSKSLFNGKDLTGWHVDVPHLDEHPKADPTFIVRDGLLVSLGQPNGHLITDANYENYRLEVEYRFAGTPGNCGVLVHASTPRALYKMFPKSIECQMNHQHAGDFWCIVEDITVPDMEKRRGPKENWGITEGKGRRILNLTDNSEKPVGQWNTMVIECFEDNIKVWVNGDLVNHGTKCSATKGQIALQAEGSEVEFRKLLLTPITKLTD